MLNNNEKQENGVSSVEQAVSYLSNCPLPVKSITIIKDVLAGEIIGEAEEVDHVMELVAGATYIVIGLGRLPSAFKPGINFVEAA